MKNLLNMYSLSGHQRCRWVWFYVWPIWRNLSFYNNNNLLHLYSTFLGTQSALHGRGGGGSPQPPPVCSIHLDDATAAILRQNTPHTPAYWWRGDRVMKPVSVWGWLGGHDGQRPMGKFGQDAGVTPLLFFEGHPGIFNDQRESGPPFNVKSEGRCFYFTV